MHYLAEDPWPATFVLSVVAVGSWISLRATQQGKYLIIGVVATGLIGLAWLIEFVWVTDAERVEAVTYDVVQAVREINPPRGLDDETVDERPTRTSNAQAFERLFSHLTPDAQFDAAGFAVPGAFARAVVKSQLENTTFEFIKMSKVQVQVGEQSRTARARFIVHAGGTTERGGTSLNFLTDGAGSEWEFGLRETEKGTWKIDRITPVRLPGGSPIFR